MQQVYTEKSACCGCSACYNACPTAAIEMLADQEGFLYPVIDEDWCSDCGKCRQICPVLHEGNYKEKNEPKFFVAAHNNSQVQTESASGGAFSALSQVILDRGGSVYGAIFDQNLKVIHARATNIQERDKMRTSKYVQSDLSEIFQDIKCDLQKRLPVLFTGTPCQTAGLRGFLGSDYKADNLYICDLICHSVPSPQIWQDFLTVLATEEGGSVTTVNFRSKNIAWDRENYIKSFYYCTENNPHMRPDERFSNLYINNGCIVRPSCYSCAFTDIHRAADITIADYWGIEKYAPALYDEKGVSLIMTSSNKGEELLAAAKSLNIQQRSASESLSEQPRLQRAKQLPTNREQFWQTYYQKGLKELLK